MTATGGRRGSKVVGAADRQWLKRVAEAAEEVDEGGGEDDRERGCALPEVAMGHVLTTPILSRLQIVK